jgi:hypothetical protein
VVSTFSFLQGDVPFPLDFTLDSPFFARILLPAAAILPPGEVNFQAHELFRRVGGVLPRVSRRGRIGPWNGGRRVRANVRQVSDAPAGNSGWELVLPLSRHIHRSHLDNPEVAPAHGMIAAATLV